MEIDEFCRKLPKIELHAHLNGSLSHSTMLALKRYHADIGLEDKTNVFCNKFQAGSGDFKNLSDCFQVFNAAHSLTTTPAALTLATMLTLKEFEDDGVCYIELRSTPRETPHMSRRQYVEALIHAIKNGPSDLKIVARLIISIDRRSTLVIAEDIGRLAIEFHKQYPDVVVGCELSGDPTAGKFQDLSPFLEQAKKAGMKVTLHCAEVSNPEEIVNMLEFHPDRIGHGTCIHPRMGGTEKTWDTLCKFNTPVEICLTSNIKSKTCPDYESHHFKEFFEAGIPVIICTDDKGVFQTSLSQEFIICAGTFKLTHSQLVRLSLNACQNIFEEGVQKIITDEVLNFFAKNPLINY